MTTEELIREAIRGRRSVALRYEGDSGRARVVHPHVLYRSSTGKICVDSYQVDGQSSPGASLPDWRPFDIAKVLDIELLEEEFNIAPGLNLSSSKYANGVLAHV